MMISTLSNLARFLRLPFDLKAFLAETLTLEQCREIVKRRIEEREDNFLDIVENIESTEEAEVSMRMLSLHELMRTSRISEVDSNVLRYYCMDEDSIYDGQIQLEAMKELAERTRQHTI